MRGERTSFERLLPVIPEGWKDKAKELGALAFGREIKLHPPGVGTAVGCVIGAVVGGLALS
jgi:hypothetical protein